MDPITAISLIGSLASLIQASNALLNIAQTFKDAEREIFELITDISAFEEALKGFNRVLRSRQTKHHISATVIKRALEEASTTIQELESRLVQMSKSEVSAVRRMKWVQHKSSLKKLHERLKEQSTMLQSFLALAHAETFLAACDQYPQFLQIRSFSADDVDGDAASFQKRASSETTTLASWSSTSSLRSVSANTSLSSFGSSGSSVLEVSSNASDEASPNPSAETPFAGALTIRKACRYNCFCRCHAQGAVTRRGLWRSSNPQSLCTDPTCQAATSSEEPTVFPSNFFRKAISQVISSKSIKVHYDLNTFRMVSEGSDAIRYVKHGNLDKLKMCIESGEATLWDTAPDGWSLLHTAAYNRQLPIVKYLLELGADTEVADVGTRFVKAIELLQDCITNKHISKPADLAILKSLADDATHVEREIVEIFSRKDDYISDFEFTPLHIAVLNLYDPGDSERPSLEQLIETVDDCNNAPAGTNWAKWKSKYEKRSPLFGDIIELFRASAFQKPKTHKIIHNLLDQKDRKYCWTPLHWASSVGQLEKMRILVDHGANPFILSNLDANILHAAAESRTISGLDGALDIWKLHPTQLNINQANRWAETPLHVAAWGSVGCVKRLLEAGADRGVRQEDQQVPLHCAGLSRRGEVRRKIAALLCGGENGPHVNAQDVDGRPPIFDFLDDPVCIHALMQHGARLDLLDNSGKSAFHHTCMQDESDALRMLLRLSPSGSLMVTVKDHDGNTALAQALRHGSIECAMVLLELDDIGDVVGQDGWALVHHAAKLGDVDVLGAVLRHPSFVKGMKTIDGKTAEVVAMEAGYWSGDVKMLIRKYNSVI